MTCFGRGLRLVMLLALVAIAPAPGGAGTEGFSERLERANALLADRSHWEEAITLYRGLLSTAPTRSDVRIRLARVLAWARRYDEALREFDRLLDDDPGDETVRIERAEVLSWAGAYPKAESAFTSILASDPEQARAARGLARVYLWSGRTGKAKVGFEQALAIEEDEEARAELETLQQEFAPRVEITEDFMSDSGDFSRFASFLEGSFFLDVDTRLFTRLGLLRIRQKRSAGDLSRAPEREQARDFALGIERRLHPHLLGSLEIGQRRWRFAPARIYVRGELEFTPSPTSMLRLRFAREGHLDHSDSRDAIAANVRGSYGRLSAWKAFSPQLEAFGQLEMGWLSDSNRLRGGTLDLSYRPWAHWTTRVGLAASVLGYASDRAAYYTPRLEAGASLTLAHRVETGGPFSLELQLEGGYGHTREAGRRAKGPQWGAQTALEWAAGGWRLGLEARYTRRQRAASYTASRVLFVLRRDF